MDLIKDKFAVISDVHGNYQALMKTLALIEKKNVKQIFFLGDAVGYGPEPKKCFELLYDKCSIFLMGNHEAMMIDGNQKKSRLCEESFTWTKGIINESILMKIKNLPLMQREEGIGFYHACPQSTLQSWKYLNEQKDIIRAFAGYEKICFYGHTHRPRVLILSDKIEDYKITETTEFLVDVSVKRIYINPGSIGQQRDNRTDLSFAICEYDGKFLKVRIERHRYNSLKTYLDTRYKGCGRSNADYLIREKWRKRLYESIGNRCGWFYR